MQHLDVRLGKEFLYFLLKHSFCWHNDKHMGFLYDVQFLCLFGSV